MMSTKDCQRREPTIKIIIAWLTMSMVMLSLLTTIHYPSFLATGANTWDSHGWPGGWLTRNEYKTWVNYGDGNGTHVDAHKVRWFISSWGSLLVAILASIAAPAAIMVPILLLRKKSIVVP